MARSPGREDLPARLWVPAAMVVAAGLVLPGGQALGIPSVGGVMGTGALLVLAAPGLFGVLAARTTTDRQAQLVVAVSAVAIVLSLSGAALVAGPTVGCPPTSDPLAVVGRQIGPFAILAGGYAVGALSARWLARAGTWAAFVIGGGVAGPAAAGALLSWISAVQGCRP